MSCLRIPTLSNYKYCINKIINVGVNTINAKYNIIILNQPF